METPSKPFPRRLGWRAPLLLVVVFFLGLGFGAGGVLLVGREMLHQALTASENEAGPVDRFLAGTERSLARRLALTPEERAAVHEELARTSHEFKRDRAVFFNSVRGIAVDTIARMARRLPPEKSAQLQKLAHQRFVSLGLLAGPSPASSPR